MTVALLVRRAGLGAALGFAVGLSYFLPALPVLYDLDAPLVDSMRSMILRSTASVMLVAMMLTIALHRTRTPWARVTAAAVAIVATCAAARIGLAPFTAVGWFEMVDESGARSAELFGIWHTTAAGVLLAAYFDQVRRSDVSSLRLREAQIRSQVIEREVLQSRLDVIRARVDPAYLFETLASVRCAYDHDPDEAERLLEDLIAFLRGSVPAEREAA